MRLLKDKTLSISSVAEFGSVSGYIERHNLSDVYLKIGYLKNIVLDENGADFNYDENLANMYNDSFEKVKGLNLVYCDSINLVNYFKNIEQLTLPYTYEVEELKNILPSFNIKELASIKTDILTNDIGINPKKILVIGSNYTGHFVHNKKDELFELNSKDFKNVQNLKSLDLRYVASLYKVKIDCKDLKSLSLVGNFNLREISIDNLDALTELRVYSNNEKCNFNPEMVASIIRANFKGENNLTKFVFDVNLYPSVQKLLEEDLKNPEFKTCFENLVFVGEEVDSCFNEIDAVKMSEFDAKIEQLIARCGVQKDDLDFDAFSKLYAFILNETTYNENIMKNGNNDKLSAVINQLIGNTNQVEKLKMLGSGINMSNTFGGFSNDMNLICAGTCRLFAYMLNKVGIKTQTLEVESLLENGKLISEPKNETNHLILKVFFQDKAVYIDPTFDVAVYNSDSEAGLSIVNDEFFKKYINNFVESKYFKQKSSKHTFAFREELYYSLCSQLYYKDRIEDMGKEVYEFASEIKSSNLSNDYDAVLNHYVARDIIKSRSKKEERVMV